MVSLRRLTACTALLLAAAASAQTPNAAALQALGTAYATYLSAGRLRDDCTARDPGTAAATKQAYAAWLSAQKLEGFDAGLRKRLGDANVTQLRSSLNPQLDALVGSMRTLGTAAQVCAAYRAQLKGDTFDVRGKVPQLNTLLGTGTAAGTTAATTTTTKAAPASTGPTVRYTVAQLSSLAGQTLAALPKTTSSSVAEQAVVSKLRALGPQVAVTGTVQRSRSLTQSDDRREVKWSVYCYDMAGDAADPPKGQTVTVVGRVRDFDRDTSLTLEGCRVVNPAGLKASTLSAADVGWRFKNQPAERFLVAAGQGLKDSEVLGVYTTQSSGIGVGGMVIVTFPPYLFLKDGTVYNDPSWAPSSFNAKLSRQLEPQKWGKWSRQGQNFQIRWGDGETETFEVQDAIKPAAAGLKLSGAYASLGGGGNTAMGGDVMVAGGSDYTFKPDGTFTGGRFGGASTSNMAVGSQSRGGGRYSIQGYGITIKPTSGPEQRLLFYRFGDALHIGGSDFVRD
ncbi:hypothetical protein K7W42_07895 [Deinococcus sp. HMF7604]|uniref:hypothetical protein n=1 Tax=Deinococcus betulae TaxID=2873312 RepID=UPI001CCC51CF|nr:hypothetical protein [Deinococcus betulae]MBZ9750782.1 hypothetical protein [Deinococcus betulae]